VTNAQKRAVEIVQRWESGKIQAFDAGELLEDALLSELFGQPDAQEFDFGYALSDYANIPDDDEEEEDFLLEDFDIVELVKA